MTTFKIIEKIIKENNDVVVNKTSNIKNDLNLDSLDLVEKLLTIEEYFMIEISDEDLIKLETIEDIVSKVDELK